MPRRVVIPRAIADERSRFRRAPEAGRVKNVAEITKLLRPVHVEMGVTRCRLACLSELTVVHKEQEESSAVLWRRAARAGILCRQPDAVVIRAHQPAGIVVSGVPLLVDAEIYRILARKILFQSVRNFGR